MLSSQTSKDDVSSKQYCGISKNYGDCWEHQTFDLIVLTAINYIICLGNLEAIMNLAVSSPGKDARGLKHHGASQLHREPPSALQ